LICIEEGLHPPHIHVRIVKEVDAWQTKWKKLKADLVALKDAATKTLGPH